MRAERFSLRRDRRPLWLAGLVAVAVGTLPLGGCGSQHEEAAREGLAVLVDGIRYNVFLSRQLNPRIPPDKAYYERPAPGPGAIHFGVFLEACNEDGLPRQTVTGFKVVDNQDNSFRPVGLPESNDFAYDAEVLEREECIPEEGSLADLGPTGGAMLLFELPLEALENRPLVLHIGTALPLPEQGRVELDL